jgi:hypothetical protein
MTVQRWGLQVGKDTEEARIVCEREAHTVAVSRDGLWVITAGGDPFYYGPGEPKTFQGS